MVPCGALSGTRQIFPNLRTAALRNLAKECMSSLSYCEHPSCRRWVSSPNAACQARLCGQRDVHLQADMCWQHVPCLYTCLLFAQRPGSVRAGIREMPTSLAILCFFIIWECTDSCLIWKVKNSQTASKD